MLTIAFFISVCSHRDEKLSMIQIKKGSRTMLLCSISIGKDGVEWVALVTYSSGKAMELRDEVFEELLHAIVRELDGLE